MIRMLLLLSLLLFALPTGNAQENKLPGTYLLCRKQPAGMALPANTQRSWFREKLKEKLCLRLETVYKPDALPEEVMEEDLAALPVGKTTHVVFYWFVVQPQEKNFGKDYLLQGGVELKKVKDSFVKGEILASVASQLTLPNVTADKEAMLIGQTSERLAQELVDKTMAQLENAMPGPSPVPSTPTTPGNQILVVPPSAGGMVWFILGMVVVTLFAMAGALFFIGKRMMRQEQVAASPSAIQGAARTFYMAMSGKHRKQSAGVQERPRRVSAEEPVRRRPLPSLSPAEASEPPASLLRLPAYTCPQCGQKLAWNDWIGCAPHCIPCLGNKPAVNEQLGNYQLLVEIRKDTFGDYFLARHVHNNQLRIVHRLPAARPDQRDPQQWPRMLLRFQRAQKVLQEFWQTRKSRDILVPNELQENRNPVCFYYTMPYLPALTLQEVMHDVWKNKPQPLATCFGVLGWLAHVLSDLHAQGIVHREIKPERIWCHVEQGLYLTGFFLLKRFRQSPTAEDGQEELGWGEPLAADRLTAGKRGLGDIVYAPFEQISEAAEADDKADIWSWGVTACELLAGANYFDRHTRKDSIQVISHYRDFGEIEKWNDCPRPFPKVLAMCEKELGKEAAAIVEETLAGTLAKQPQDRVSATVALANMRQLRHLITAP